MSNGVMGLICLGLDVVVWGWGGWICSGNVVGVEEQLTIAWV